APVAETSMIGAAPARNASGAGPSARARHVPSDIESMGDAANELGPSFDGRADDSAVPQSAARLSETDGDLLHIPEPVDRRGRRPAVAPAAHGAVDEARAGHVRSGRNRSDPAQGRHRSRNETRLRRSYADFTAVVRPPTSNARVLEERAG